MEAQVFTSVSHRCRQIFDGEPFVGRGQIETFTCVQLLLAVASTADVDLIMHHRGRDSTSPTGHAGCEQRPFVFHGVKLFDGIETIATIVAT